MINFNKNTSLNELNLPEDLNKMSVKQMEILCHKIRKKLIETVSKTGGHLASNLGTVELSVAMHKVFDCPEDRFVFDVGHQGYTHKILTGRLSEFDTLRQENGLSGFVKPRESEYDAFISGHASNSVSAALGIATALKKQGKKDYTLAVIGDGSLSGGLAYEGLNNAGKSGTKLIVILNQNDMSISENVGAVAKYLTTLRTKQSYVKTKNTVSEILESTPILGDPMKKAISYTKETLKKSIINSTLFEYFGFEFVGPVNGHNLDELIEALEDAKAMEKPVLINVKTVKGKGYLPAEKKPDVFHGVGKFDVKTGETHSKNEDTFSDVFGKNLAILAKNDNKIFSVTAAMENGTGLQHFTKEFRSRFFDVGIAESHAVTFCAGLAKTGIVPVFCVYSTFLQRCYDQILHDAALDNSHIVLGIDRAGIVGDDGETHQGLFDVPFLTTIPNVTIYSPSNFEELKFAQNNAIYNDEGIVAVRYPRGSEDVNSNNISCAYDYLFVKNDNDTLVISYGRLINNIFSARENAQFDILKLVKIFPVDSKIISEILKYKRIFFFEESYENGGIAEKFLAYAYKNGYKGEFYTYAINEFVQQSSLESAFAKYKFDSNSIIDVITSEDKNG